MKNIKFFLVLAVQLIEKKNALDFASPKYMSEQVEGSYRAKSALEQDYIEDLKMVASSYDYAPEQLLQRQREGMAIVKQQGKYAELSQSLILIYVEWREEKTLQQRPCGG